MYFFVIAVWAWSLYLSHRTYRSIFYPPPELESDADSDVESETEDDPYIY
jgi:hypothetical protein